MFGRSVFRLLVLLYPPGFRDRFGTEMLAEFEPEKDGARIFHRFWLRDLRDISGLNRLIDIMGIGKELSLKEAVKGAKGYEVMGYVFPKANEDDPKHPFINVKQFAAVG